MGCPEAMVQRCTVGFLTASGIILPEWPGWHLVGQYDSEVGCWLLHHGGEAMLLEVPEGLSLPDVKQAVRELGVRIKYVSASHTHMDHLDSKSWNALARYYEAEMLSPKGFHYFHTELDLGGEPLFLIKAPKHSWNDVVTVFRGIAMTGDIELGTLDSCNREVPEPTKRMSMGRLRDFQRKYRYHVHSVVSAHLDDLRQNVNWESLFSY